MARLRPAIGVRGGVYQLLLTCLGDKMLRADDTQKGEMAAYVVGIACYQPHLARNADNISRRRAALPGVASSE